MRLHAAAHLPHDPAYRTDAITKRRTDREIRQPDDTDEQHAHRNERSPRRERSGGLAHVDLGRRDLRCRRHGRQDTLGGKRGAATQRAGHQQPCPHNPHRRNCRAAVRGYRAVIVLCMPPRV